MVIFSIEEVIPVLRETRKKELKQTLFLTALRLFQEKGFEQVTVDEIVQACGVAKGTFFNYFPKKEHVLLHLGHSQMEKVEASIGLHSELGLKERLLVLFDGLMDAYREHSELLKLTLTETLRSAVLMGEEISTVNRFQASLERLIRESLASGSIRTPWEPAVMASVLVGLYFNTVLTWSMQQGAPPPAESFRQQFELVWNGIETRE